MRPIVKKKKVLDVSQTNKTKPLNKKQENKRKNKKIKRKEELYLLLNRKSHCVE